MQVRQPYVDSCIRELQRLAPDCAIVVREMPAKLGWEITAEHCGHMRSCRFSEFSSEGVALQKIVDLISEVRALVATPSHWMAL